MDPIAIFRTPRLAFQKGQVVIEYILLLVIVVGATALLAGRLTTRDPQSPGVFIAKWCEIMKMIAADDPNVRSPKPMAPGCKN